MEWIEDGREDFTSKNPAGYQLLKITHQYQSGWDCYWENPNDDDDYAHIGFKPTKVQAIEMMERFENLRQKGLHTEWEEEEE